MANDIYLLTHDGLAQMVSSRAATRLLDKALEAKGYSSDAVTSEEMREVLQGSVLRELRQILPKDGVERSIKQLSRSLRKHAEKVAEALFAVANAPASGADLSALSRGPSNLPPIAISGDVLLTDEDEDSEQIASYAAVNNDAKVTDAEADDLGIIHHSSQVVSPLEDSQAFDTGEVEAALAILLNSEEAEAAFEVQAATTPSANTGGTQSLSTPTHEVHAVQPVTLIESETKVVSESWGNPVPANLVTTHLAQPSPATATSVKEYSPETLAKMLVKFAQLDNVKVVAAVRPNGEISMARGSGFDVDALSRLGSLGIKLLRRGRVIRSYYLSHSRYQLFMFPLPSHTLIVVGSSEVNVGEVFSILSRLEEEV
jgi:hypothetical protein